MSIIQRLQPNRDINRGTRRGTAMTLTLIVFLAGCSRATHQVASVHGKVTVDAKPLANAKVRFAPIANGDNTTPGKPAWGQIQDDGSFRLTTYRNGDGAVVGEHWVTILNAHEELPDGVPDFSRLMIAKKVEVVAGKDNDFNFALTSDEVKKYREK